MKGKNAAFFLFRRALFIPMIVGEVKRVMRSSNSLRVARSIRDTAYKVLQARAEIEAKKDDVATMAEIAQTLAIPEREVVYALDAISDPVSLYDPVYNKNGDTLLVMDQIGDENSSDACWLQQLALKDAISRLTPRQRDILALRYSEGKTQTEVSREIGISQAQVSRLEKGAIGEIKKNL